jgi:hypothetical protein
MRFQVCTVSPALARAWASARERVPFLPPPEPAPDPCAVIAPSACACGAPFEMEMERDLGECVDCAFRAAEAAYGRPK